MYSESLCTRMTCMGYVINNCGFRITRIDLLNTQRSWVQPSITLTVCCTRNHSTPSIFNSLHYPFRSNGFIAQELWKVSLNHTLPASLHYNTHTKSSNATSRLHRRTQPSQLIYIQFYDEGLSVPDTVLATATWAIFRLFTLRLGSPHQLVPDYRRCSFDRQTVLITIIIIIIIMVITSLLANTYVVEEECLFCNAAWSHWPQCLYELHFTNFTPSVKSELI
jgi:hypothetical protein